MTKLSIHTKLRKFYLSLLFTSVLTLINLNVLYIEHLPAWMGIFNLIYYLTVPGYLLTKVVRFKAKFGVTLGYSVVLSISFLIFLGFLINNLLPVFFIDRPLSRLPFVISANISIIVMYFLVLVHEDPFTIPKKFPKLKIHFLSFIFSFVAVLFPVLTALGSNLLNNGGSNIFNLIALFGIAIYALTLIIFRKHLQDYVFPFAIYFIGLGMLFIYAIRTPNLMGWDVQTEYKVFQLTKVQYQWTVLNYHNAYNATLGITILPTLLSNFIEIRDFYIFKIIYPILFSFSGIGVYYIFKRYLTRTAAFLAAFFVVIQMSFASMPSLARQEIAYLAFVFIILTLFDKVNKAFPKNALFLILGSTIVVSHYTTTYITVGLFVSAYISGKCIQLLYKILHRYKPRWTLPPVKLHLVGLNVLYMVIITILWYGVYTNASSNIQNFFQSINDNISKIQTQEGRAGQSWITVTGKGRTSTTQDLSNYEQSTRKQRNPYMYPEELINRYPVFQKPAEFIPYNKFFMQIPDFIGIFVKQLMKILILSGICLVIFLAIFRRKYLLDTEFLLMSAFYIFLIILAIFIPKVSAQYNMERLYQQGLVFLAVYPLFLTLYLFPRLFNTFKYIFLCLIFIIYMFTYHGIISQFFGGSPTMNLNNYGVEYSQYYIHDSELVSAKWINSNRSNTNFFYADLYAELRLASEANIPYIQKHIVPAALWPGAYVYGSYENINVGRVQTKYNNALLMHNFPKQFLMENKDVIYSNKLNEIYK